VVLASLLVSPPVLATARLPATELPTTTPCKPDRQAGDATFDDAIAAGDATFDDAIAAGDATFDNAIAAGNAAFDNANAAGDATFDDAGNQSIAPTDDETIDNAANAARQPGTICGAPAQDEQAGAATLIEKNRVEPGFSLLSEKSRFDPNYYRSSCFKISRIGLSAIGISVVASSQMLVSAVAAICDCAQFPRTTPLDSTRGPIAANQI
jgi:hypothetical protein